MNNEGLKRELEERGERGDTVRPTLPFFFFTPYLLSGRQQPVRLWLTHTGFVT